MFDQGNLIHNLRLLFIREKQYEKENRKINQTGIKHSCLDKVEAIKPERSGSIIWFGSTVNSTCSQVADSMQQREKERAESSDVLKFQLSCTSILRGEQEGVECIWNKRLTCFQAIHGQNINSRPKIDQDLLIPTPALYNTQTYGCKNYIWNFKVPNPFSPYYNKIH